MHTYAAAVSSVYQVLIKSNYGYWWGVADKEHCPVVVSWRSYYKGDYSSQRNEMEAFLLLFLSIFGTF